MQTDYKEKSTITVDENDILKMSAKIQQNKRDDENFSAQVDKFIEGKMPIFETLSLGATPNVLHLVGANADTLTMKQSVLRNSILDEEHRTSSHSSGHNISKEIIKQLPESLRNPILILKGQHPHTVVALTELTNKDDKNILVPIALDLRSTDSIVNKVTSIYGKNDISRYLNKHQNDIIAVNKQKADELFTTIGYQLSKTTSATICYDNSIAYSTQNVKHPEQNLQYDNIIDKLSSEGKAEINDDGSFKINNDFYRELPRDDRATEVVPARHAMEIMQQLSDSGIEFSAVSRQNDNAAITVHKDKIDILKHTAENIAEKTIRQDDVKSSDSDKINPEYYNKLKKDERKVIRLPHNSGDKAISALQSAGIPFSAVKSEKLTSITVHKDNAQALDQIISDGSKQTAKEYINSDFFKSLPPEERLYTQISGTDKANELMSELKNNNIGFSAVIDKEKNSAKVTVAKKDTSALKKVTDSLFSRKAQKDFSDKAKSLNQEHNTRNIAKNKDNQHSI